MKKLIFTLPFLALAIFLAYCTKSDVKEGLDAADTKAAERGLCKVRVYPSSFDPLTYCGTQSNAQTCSNACISTVSGVEVIVGDGKMSLTTPTKFSLSSVYGEVVYVETATNLYGPVTIPAGGCQYFVVDDDCTVHQ